ncbi:MAG: PEPxxWA-CTERM sorting domain-containing protein [Polymorphobacter sp.]
MAEARSISQIYFAGNGVVTWSEGRAPHPGWPIRISGNVKFFETNCLPADIDGTIDLGNPYEGTSLCDNIWSFGDQFIDIDYASQRTVSLLTFDHGNLVGVEFRGEAGPEYFAIDSTNFYGEWSYIAPYAGRYAGNWALNDVRIAYDGGPLPNPVPEPASWTLMIAGFALIGAMQRRQVPQHA